MVGLACVLVSLLLAVRQSNCLTLNVHISPSPVEPMGSAAIVCEVENLPAGSMIVWYKRQAQGSPDVIGFNNAIYNPAYKDRFTARNAETIGNKVVFALDLKGADLKDAGDYGCGTSEGNIVYAKLSITMPVREVKMFALRGNETDEGQAVELDPGQNFEVIVGDSYYVRCVAYGSNPPADVVMKLDDTDITNRFNKQQEVFHDEDIISPHGAQNYELFNVMLTSREPLKVKEEYNRKRLTCSASIPNRNAVSVYVRPVFRAAPTLKCEKGPNVPSLSSDVTLRCTSEADPELTTAVWYWTGISPSFNETLPVGDKVGKMEARMFVQEETGEHVIELHFEQVASQMFRRYHLRVANVIGERVSYVELTRDTSNEHNHSTNIMASCILLLISVLTAVKFS